MRQKYTGDDVRARLSGTVIRYKGVPYYCEVEESSFLNLYSLTTNDLQCRVAFQDSEIDISTINLGYINASHGSDIRCAIYLKRDPLRQFKQGVILSQLKQKVLSSRHCVVNAKVLQSKGLEECNLNIYPSIDTAMSLMSRGTVESVALSRNCAIMRNEEQKGYIFFVKESSVGFIHDKTKTVIVKKNDKTEWSIPFMTEIPDLKISY